MRKKLLFVALITASLLFHNKVAAQVSSSFDSGANFGKYVTYSFLGWQNQSNESISMEDQKVILNSLEREFGKRGITRLKSEGSAVILLYVVMDEKTAEADYLDHLRQYGYSNQKAEDVKMEGDTLVVEFSEINYTQGSLIVNMHDAETRKLVWRAVVTDVVQKDPATREVTIPEHVAELMKTYPIQN